ncbi:MAG: hypothetical protein GY870_21260, partial [archaeon]|nr:hypothetical protein [archaeon]
AHTGKELIKSHLLKMEFRDFDIKNNLKNNTIQCEKVVYDEKKKRIYLNSSVFFEKIKKNIWFFEIGGYQVIKTYLKRFKGGYMIAHDIEEFQKILFSINYSIDLIAKIDELCIPIFQLKNNIYRLPQEV